VISGNSDSTTGVQKLSGAVFCTHPAAEKLTVLYQINGESPDFVLIQPVKGEA